MRSFSRKKHKRTPGTYTCLAKHCLPPFVNQDPWAQVQCFQSVPPIQRLQMGHHGVTMDHGITVV